MPKILGIVGSPRKKGNTHILVSKMLEGAEAEGAETDILLLGKLEIRECTGCHACWKGKRKSKMKTKKTLFWPKKRGFPRQ